MKNNKVKELSYYQLTLLSYLKESHPELATKEDFIESRADSAAKEYSQTIKDGLSHDIAAERANTVLFQNLHFSQLDVLITVIWNEYSDIIAESEARNYALKILPECNLVFNRYELSDDFSGTKEYDSLYSELVGMVLIWLEENGIQ